MHKGHALNHIGRGGIGDVWRSGEWWREVVVRHKGLFNLIPDDEVFGPIANNFTTSSLLGVQ